MLGVILDEIWKELNRIIDQSGFGGGEGEGKTVRKRDLATA